MTRQKLPDGWSIDWEGDAIGQSKDVAIAMIPDTDALVVRVLECECGWQSRSMPAPVALAVIRNAGADAVYEAAKRLVTDGPKGFGENFTSLRELIESSEEP